MFCQTASFCYVFCFVELEDSKLQSATAKQKRDRKIKFDRG